MAAFALAGRLFTVNLLTAPHSRSTPRVRCSTRRPGSNGHESRASGRSLCIADLDGTTRIIEDPDPNVSWGSAEFIAAEEMGATGYWWARMATAPPRRVDI